MAATVAIIGWYGASITYSTELTDGFRLCTTDGDPNTLYDSTTYPVKIPSADYNYSYWFHLGLKVTGTYTAVRNVYFWCDGDIGWNFGTTGALLVGLRDSGDMGCPTGSYDQATGTSGETGHYIDDATNGHTYYKAATANPGNIETYVTGNKLQVHTSATGDITGNPGYSNAVVLQVKVGTDASSGIQTEETLNFQWDEIN